MNSHPVSSMFWGGGLRLSGQEGGNRRVQARGRDGGDTVRALGMGVGGEDFHHT